MTNAPEDEGFYADEVSITFNHVDNMSLRPVKASYQVVFNPGGPVDFEWLSGQIRSLLVQSDPDTGARYVRYDHVITEQRRETHWGAAGGTIEFVIDTAAFIGEHGAGELVSLILGAFIERLRARGYEVRHGSLEQLSENEAMNIGLEAIESLYDTVLSALTIESVGKNERDEHVVVARDSDGYTYSVTFVVRGGVTTVRAHHKKFPDCGE